MIFRKKKPPIKINTQSLLVDFDIYKTKTVSNDPFKNQCWPIRLIRLLIYEVNNSRISIQLNRFHSVSV